MQRERSVARLLAPVNVHVALVVVALTTLGVAGIAWSGHTVDRLTDQIAPVASANTAVQRDMLILQAGTQAWVQSGTAVVLGPARIAAARLEANQRRTAAYARSRPALAALVAAQDTAIAAWREYSDARTERPGGLGAYDPREYVEADRRFGEFERAHAATTAAFDQEIQRAKDAASNRLSGTVAAMVVVGLGGLVLLRRTRRRLLRALEHPLRNLEDVAHRLAGDDTGLRAELAGPREVRAVARALNELAASHERALAVEDRLRADQLALDSAKDDFVSNVSHELRTPLTTLNGYLELVQDEFEGQLAPRHQKMMDVCSRNVARLRSLIEDLLTLSRSETQTPSPEPVDLSALVTDVVDDLRVTASRRGIRLTVDDGVPDEPRVVADRPQLLRALINLVGNAVKFSHDGGLVTLSLAREGEVLSVGIRDEGLGIPEDELGRLGHRFFRASNAVTQEIAGTGLGLRIAQSIIHAHGGELTIRSQQHRGTTVTVQLAAASSRDGATAPAGPHPPAPRRPVAATSRDAEGPRPVPWPGPT